MFSSKEKLQPARDQYEGPVQDIDAIIEKPEYIKLHGVVHEIKPVLVNEFFALANALARLNNLTAQKEINLDDLVDTYFGLIRSVCPTIEKEDIRKCTNAQVAAILQKVYDHVNGISGEKKKTPLTFQPKILQGRSTPAS
jgi:hypothetical protein